MIRFQGFTDDWIQCKLGDVIEISSASRVHKDEWTKEGIPFFRSSDVTSIFKGTQNTKAFISYELYESLSEKSGKVKTHDVLATGGGSIAVPYLVPNDEPMYFKDADLIWMKTNETLEGRFLYNFFTSPTLRNYVQTISHVGTISHYTIEQAKDTPITLPSLKEQTAIGNYFRTLDNAIHNHQQKLNCLRELKKGYLQQMFPQDGETVPKVRFDGFVGDWQSVHLGDIVEKLKSYSLSRDVETSDVTGYRYIHYGDIHKQVADIITDDEQLPCIKIGDYIALKQGDLVLADTSEDYIGIAEPCVILHEPQEHIIAGLHTIAIRPINTDSLFLYHLLHTDGFRKFGGFVGTGLKVFGITFSNVSKYEMKLPSFAEQAVIGGFFLNLDMQISSTITKLEKLKHLKAAYMQKMFI
jgi:type I restriction enzyme S subunit